ncbi:exodeoxyribonuclease I [Buchnera aphidicola]|uniref:exodeoxyribonuclease I n=1 Tax=Buchnera aphidicola TaxID=9 RepID=UPI002543648A|nr:exodeoxyribonuclease I [Buchnera aphidicola]WII23654.1 exodeoxyribonuclease I [Buchnera aphidicola (Sipha maydis)]
MKNFSKFSFLFYDYETFGVNPVKDRPAQFACLRTDINFNVISNPTVLYCYPPLDYLPNPESILITSITPQYTLLNNGLNESDFSKKIYDIFIQANTCILGFNNILFDDEITRNIFYRNFFDAYEWSWKNHNTRWDVINLLRAFYALRPSGISWPWNKVKKCVSFKLQDFSKSNDLFHDKAHHALSDVYATIEVLKLLKKKNFNFFRFLFFMRKKKKILKFIEKNYRKPLIYISHYYGSKNNNFSRIFPLTLHYENKNILIAFDLDRLYSDFFLENKKEIYKNINVLFSHGMRLIFLNKSPILIPINVLREKDISRLKLNQSRFLKNFIFFKKFFNKNIIQKLSRIRFEYKYFKHSDYKLYEKFFTLFDRIQMKKIRENINKKNINHGLKMYDSRFTDLNFFFKARNFPHYLTQIERLRWKKYLKNFFNKKKIYKYKKNIFLLKKKYLHNIKNQNLLDKLLFYLKYLKKLLKST